MADLSAIARLVRIAVPGCPEPLIADAIIDAAIAFCRQTRAVTETLSLITVIGQSAYPLTTSTNTRAWRATRLERGTVALDPSSKPIFDANPHLRSGGTPDHYYLENDQIVLGPVPSEVGTLTLSVAVEPVLGATTLPDVLQDEWRRVIASGAKASLLVIPNVPWQSVNDAAIENAIFNGGIDAALFKRDSGGTGVVPRSSPSWC